MINKCPYCLEDVKERTPKCPHCAQYLLDELIETDFHGVQTQQCIFCGKKIMARARICKHCKKWNDEVERTVRDIEYMDDEDVF